MKKDVLKKFRKFQRETPMLESPVIKVAGLQHKCFPLEFAKFLRTSILKNCCFQVSLSEIISQSGFS